MDALVKNQVWKGDPTTKIRHYGPSQVPWIVKTDDDMINNIWKLGALVEALKFQRWSKTNDLVAFCVQAL